MRTVAFVAGAVDTTTVAGRVKAARIKSGMKVPDVAQRAGHKRSWLYDIEGGKYTPNPDDLRAVAAALEIDAGYLLSGTETGDTEFIARMRGLEASLSTRSQRELLQIAAMKADEDRAADAQAARVTEMLERAAVLGPDAVERLRQEFERLGWLQPARSRRGAPGTAEAAPAARRRAAGQ